MDSSRGQNGIQLLLAAEQEAQLIVNAARNGMYLLCCIGPTSFPVPVHMIVLNSVILKVDKIDVPSILLLPSEVKYTLI